MIGLRLADLLKAAGLDVASYVGSYNIIETPPGMRPPAWAARDAMLAQGTVTQADIDRWEAAMKRMDAAPVRPVVFAPVFVAVGRKP